MPGWSGRWLPESSTGPDGLTGLSTDTDPSPPAQTGARFRAAGPLGAVARPAALGLLTSVVAGPVAFPDLLGGLDRFEPVAQVMALRPQLVVAMFVLGCLALLACLVRVGWWPVAAVLVTASLIGAATIAPRAIPDLAPPIAGGRTLTVLSFNTFEGHADPAALAALIGREHPDLVSLPEAGAPYRARLAPLLEPLGYRLWSSTPSGLPDVRGVTALAGPGLQGLRERVDEHTGRPALELSGGDLGTLRFVAFHAIAPAGGRTTSWRRDLEQLPQWCAGHTPAVVAGDFNATLDHTVFRREIRGCADAAEVQGEGLVPTWSARRSLRRFAIQLDHVLTTSGIRAESFAVLDLPGSDHRAILTRLQVPATSAAPPPTTAQPEPTTASTAPTTGAGPPGRTASAGR